MHKVQLVSSENSEISFEIYVHPALVIDWCNYNDLNEQQIWINGRSVTKRIDGKEITLVDIPDEVLNNLSGDNDYEVVGINLQFEYELEDDDKYLGRNPIYFYVFLRNRLTEQAWGKHYVLLDYNTPKWYMKLLDKYQRLKQETEKLKQELVHEKYRPGGSGYEKAKEDFEAKCTY